MTARRRRVLRNFIGGAGASVGPNTETGHPLRFSAKPGARLNLPVDGALAV
jgi:hypothetical protein